jgi:hypothetical protein
MEEGGRTYLKQNKKFVLGDTIQERVEGPKGRREKERRAGGRTSRERERWEEEAGRRTNSRKEEKYLK